MRHTPLILIPTLLSLALAACADNTAPTSGAAPQSGADAHHDHDHHDHADHDHDTPARTDTYAGIRGQIAQVPVEGDPSKPDFKIRHEHIPDFKTKDGTINVNAKGIPGMASMTMPFPVAQGVSLEGFSEGDKVVFDFAVNWGDSGRPAWEITRIEKLDPATEIDYSNTPAADQSTDDHEDHDHADHDGHDHGHEEP